MTEYQRRKYNREVERVAQLERDVLATYGEGKRTAIKKLKAAWIAFDERWSERTPTEAMMGRWLDTLSTRTVSK